MWWRMVIPGGGDSYFILEREIRIWNTKKIIVSRKLHVSLLLLMGVDLNREKAMHKYTFKYEKTCDF